MNVGSRQISLWRLFQISRPRFWIYVLGPFLVGSAAAWSAPVEISNVWWLVALFVYFTWPANFLIYGINDMFDWETDQLNAKKQGYELPLPKTEHRAVLVVSTLTTLPMLVVTFMVSASAGWCLLGFVLLGIFYSAPPLRAKTKPVFDSVFNGLYIFPGLVGFAFVAQQLPVWQLLVAAWLWAMAMHAYSAVPDILADTQAGLKTIATTFGHQGTLLFCATCYVVSIVLSLPTLGGWAVIAGGVYLVLMGISWSRTGEELFHVYRWFPVVNTLIGFGLFCLAVFG
jgi:lycopene elongase/hydratase (dihydrobisanhydrobacterioruberin-forming)